MKKCPSEMHGKVKCIKICHTLKHFATGNFINQKPLISLEWFIIIIKFLKIKSTYSTNPWFDDEPNSIMVSSLYNPTGTLYLPIFSLAAPQDVNMQGISDCGPSPFLIAS